ncbi:MAG: GNAT family N-acetyltransferase [Anaerolineales bacterium]|nr:GNAT family N-acetyltransferase [Anaerolineales bacterium]
MQILPVQNKSELKQFVEFPYHFYKDDPVWVPPLRDDQRGIFDPKRNPLLKHCEWQLFLLEDKGRIIGRIASFIDKLAVDFWGEKIGLFGHYDCIPNPAASEMLISAARKWQQARSMQAMRGPWSFVTQEWGLVVEGFEPSPVIMAPYNPPYYSEQMEASGLEKVKDLLCWYISAQEGYQIPERILTLTDTIAKRYGVRIRQVDMKHYDREVQSFLEMSNTSILDNWGYSPVTEAESQAVARDLRMILQPKGCLFAEDASGRPIGFALALPDINTLLKGLDGRLLPFTLPKLLWELPRLKRYRMFALGVIPEYQGKAVDSLLYRALYESLFTEELWMEINYVLEDNWPMINAIKKLNATPLRRYRIYQQAI